VTSAVIGASSVQQLEENLGSLEKPAFEAEELANIERILAS
jgi:aryl-alcohol dehydrogenase-like predicted oxidoreductase